MAKRRAGEEFKNGMQSKAAAWERTIMSWYIALRIAEYCENMDGVAEAARRPRRRLDLGGMTFDEAERVRRGPGEDACGNDVDDEVFQQPGQRTSEVPRFVRRR